MTGWIILTVGIVTLAVLAAVYVVARAADRQPDYLDDDFWRGPRI